ncbi:ankyrin repeat domain-containing protein 16-like isoform X2 [Prorops nasuta]|uniref:ankyrin repeat domain-containing protein 16-like isoform X2 n=1 Tax=Prorops nasuta TaxID=863751 RepID=UPI0034CE561B
MEPDPNLCKEFLRACQSGDLSRVKFLREKYEIPDWTNFQHDISGDTALHLAAREGHLEIVQFLCEDWQMTDSCNNKVDVTNKDMKRPLHEAAQFSHNDIIKYLLSQGAQVDSLKRGDWTPLMLACTKNVSEACKCIETLLDANANPQLRNKDGWTPLLLVSRSGDAEGFKLLMNKSSELLVDKSKNGRTAWHIAAFHGHRNIIDQLMESIPWNINVRDSSGSTPLHESVKNKDFSIFYHLIKLGADPKAVDNVGQTILHLAALTGNKNVIEYVIKKELIDIHAKGCFEVTPLVAARRSKQAEAVETLLKLGANR